MTAGSGKGPRSDINVTPLVDVVLVLLIIFMVLTPLMEKQIGVRVPEHQTEPTPPPPPDEIPQQIVLRVKENGRVFVNAEELNDGTMVDRLRAYYRLAKSQEAKQGPPIIFFDADDKAKYGRAVKALDVIRESSPAAPRGWTIGMMTEKLKSEEVPGAPGGGATGPTPPAPPQ